jgi:hypothetical protein
VKTVKTEYEEKITKIKATEKKPVVTGKVNLAGGKPNGGPPTNAIKLKIPEEEK